MPPLLIQPETDKKIGDGVLTIPPRRHSPSENSMKMDRRTFAVTLLAGVAASRLAHANEAQVGSRARNVVLVHGAYADGSSWSEVIPLLQRAGLNVSAVQNPLTSLADDVEDRKSVVEGKSGESGGWGE